VSEATTVSGREPTLAMVLLAAGIPLSLLVDLIEPNGPDSALISTRERLDD
jgi:hypothetical protein